MKRAVFREAVVRFCLMYRTSVLCTHDNIKEILNQHSLAWFERAGSISRRSFTRQGGGGGASSARNEW